MMFVLHTIEHIASTLPAVMAGYRSQPSWLISVSNRRGWFLLASRPGWFLSSAVVADS